MREGDGAPQGLSPFSSRKGLRGQTQQPSQLSPRPEEEPPQSGGGPSCLPACPTAGASAPSPPRWSPPNDRAPASRRPEVRRSSPASPPAQG